MAGGNGVGPGFRSIGWDWLRTLLSLVITASLFHPGAPAAVKPIGEPEFNHLLEKAENGSLTAEIQVARAYASGQRGEIKYDEAARWYHKAADAGDPDSQTNLGLFYLIGRGVERDEREAVRWFQRAAASGYALAQHNLAVVYLNGWGVVKDFDRGMNLLMRSAAAGLEISQMDLGEAYMKGEFTPRDPERGIKWLKRASRRNFPPATFLLGVCYENGDGVEKDFRKAAELLRKSAELGFAPAQNNLGRLYFDGEGVKQDKREALRLFSAAAEQGIGQSYLNLALCSLLGCARVIDVTAAYGWYLAANASGVPMPETFQNRFAQIAAALDPEQIAKAQADSRNWIAQHPSPDPRSPTQLTHLPSTALAGNRQTIRTTNSEVIRTLWQQTPSMPPPLPSHDSVR